MVPTPLLQFRERVLKALSAFSVVDSGRVDVDFAPISETDQAHGLVRPEWDGEEPHYVRILFDADMVERCLEEGDWEYLEYVAWHEICHVLQAFLYGRSEFYKRQADRKVNRLSITRYGETNELEREAEWFALWMVSRR